MSQQQPIWVETRRLETVIHVRDWPTRGQGLFVCSCNEGEGRTGITEGDWKQGDRDAISKRLGGGKTGKVGGLSGVASPFVVYDRFEVVAAAAVEREP